MGIFQPVILVFGGVYTEKNILTWGIAGFEMGSTSANFVCSPVKHPTWCYLGARDTTGTVRDAAFANCFNHQGVFKWSGCPNRKHHGCSIYDHGARRFVVKKLYLFVKQLLLEILGVQSCFFCCCIPIKGMRKNTIKQIFIVSQKVSQRRVSSWMRRDLNLAGSSLSNTCRVQRLTGLWLWRCEPWYPWAKHSNRWDFDLDRRDFVRRNLPDLIPQEICVWMKHWRLRYTCTSLWLLD